MWSWGHLAIGYLLCSVWHHQRFGRPLDPTVAIVAVLATQAPDLVDKPLAWWLGVLPSGRALGHSLVVCAVLLSGAWWLSVRADRRPLGVVFAVGYLSHLAADILYPALAGDIGNLTFLLWPLLSLPAYDVGPSIAAHVAAVPPERVVFETLLFAVAVVVWVWDGYPGVAIPKRVERALTAE